MGGCVGQQRNITSYFSGEPSDASGTVSVGRNQPLHPEKPKWKSDIPITEGQLQSRRDEFWDTAPAFEGHKEIWDALKAAASAHELGDLLLAQAIVDGANITMPTGSLVDCYDELGNRYQLPAYVLSNPTNLIDSRSLTSGSTPSPRSDSFVHQSTTRRKRSRGVEIPVRIQLSTGQELKLIVRNTDTIFYLKKQIQMSEKINPSLCRLFFAGRLLADRSRVKDAKICKNYTVQCIVSENPPPVVESKDPSNQSAPAVVEVHHTS